MALWSTPAVGAGDGTTGAAAVTAIAGNGVARITGTCNGVAGRRNVHHPASTSATNATPIIA